MPLIQPAEALAVTLEQNLALGILGDEFLDPRSESPVGHVHGNAFVSAHDRLAFLRPSLLQGPSSGSLRLKFGGVFLLHVILHLVRGDVDVLDLTLFQSLGVQPQSIVAGASVGQVSGFENEAEFVEKRAFENRGAMRVRIPGLLFQHQGLLGQKAHQPARELAGQMVELVSVLTPAIALFEWLVLQNLHPIPVVLR
ncbi:hypothetical protein Mapa_012338 [Marchantia paleacea]|nr:hypothetical protein Mapa_012338 [Marchantia paleacea]